MNVKQKEMLIQEVRRQSEVLGSAASVARKCGVSEASLSQILSGTYKVQSDDIYYRIADALGLELTVEDKWNIVETRSYRMLTTVFRDAQVGAQFRAISERAGSGKSTAARQYARQHPRSVFYLQCREWSRSKFIEQLTRLLGLATSHDIDECIESVSDFFRRKSADAPLLIIDEADKLKPAAIRLLIPIYNECEGRLGVVIAGTDNLEKEFKRGVKYNQKGYDELMSRFGRAFVHLVGEDKLSVAAICKANGIRDNSVVAEIFNACDTQSMAVGNVFQTVIKDIRQLRSKVEGWRLLNKEQNRAMEAQVA